MFSFVASPFKAVPWLTAGLCASALVGSAEQVTAGHGASTPPSRFGKLTSRRWAHGQPYERAHLAPVKNPHPGPQPQPRRDHPFDVVVSPDGRKVYVTLQGSELEPGNEVAVYDVARDAAVRRILLKRRTEIGTAALSPFRLAFHPAGRFILVTHRFSNFASVIDSETDQVISEIPLDFYCQGIAFDGDGRKAYVANRYLDQVFVMDVRAEGGTFEARMRELGGLDEKAFSDRIHGILVRRCGSCHAQPQGGFTAGPDARRSLVSVLPHVRPGRASESRLLRAVTGTQNGGYADAFPRVRSHAQGTVVFRRPDRDPDYEALRDWIDAASEGPGIPIGNPGSKPKICALTPGGRLLLVGNTGTQDVAVVDTRTNREVGDIYIQNVVNDLKVYRSAKTGEDHLLVSTLGVGFGVARERDPYGGEAWESANPASHFTVWRDLATGRVKPRSQQEVLGPFQAVDGTAGIKFRDIQNDLLIVKLNALKIPEEAPREGLPHLLMAHRYEAHRGWVRYTSDTAESTAGDMKGDIPPDLMRVVGSFPEKMALVGDRLFVTMQASGQVQEWKIQPEAPDPCDALIPKAVYSTGLQPIGIAAGPPGTISEGLLFVANFLGGSLSVIDTRKKTSREVVVDPSIIRRPVPDTDSERGEIFVHSSLFSSDGDTSCFHCHYFDMGDGRPWGVSQVVGQEYLSPDDAEGQFVIGGTMGVPQMRALFENQPFFYEGTLSAYEPRSMIMEHNPAEDYLSPLPRGLDLTGIQSHLTPIGDEDVQSRMQASTSIQPTLEERRDEMFRTVSMSTFGKAFTLRDFQRFVGEWQVAEPHLLPNPFDPTNECVQRGRELFLHPQVGCSSCHPPPAFTRKNLPDNPEQAIPPVVTFSVRDGAFTLVGMNRLDAINGHLRDLEPWDRGRMEREQGSITISQLRGLWDRPPVFLHHGLARTLHEVVATPGHLGLRRFRYMPLLGGSPERPGRNEVGFNETFWYTERSRMGRVHFASQGRIGLDTHGGTSHLSAQQIDDIVHFMMSIE
ncbi:MAG: hypothetical protein HYU36_01650 [Planctomycetes bacterium]|nr:hypothetical protein [Planctomycetota bacterium]